MSTASPTSKLLINMFYMYITSFIPWNSTGVHIYLFCFLEILGTLGGQTSQGWKVVGVEKPGNSSWKGRKALSGKNVQTLNMPVGVGGGGCCLILRPLCNMCIIGDRQVLANNKNYLKLENVNHSSWNLARVLGLFHVVLTQTTLSTGL